MLYSSFQPRKQITGLRMVPSVILLLVVLGIQGAIGRVMLPFGAEPARAFAVTRSNPGASPSRSPVPSAPRLDQLVDAPAGTSGGVPAARHAGHYLSRSARNQSLFVRFGAQGRLAARLLSDLMAAAVASFMVSPFISIADRAIIQSSSGAMSMQGSVQQGLKVLATKPALFLARPDFICTFCLYGATYLAANTISTVADELRRSDTWPRFLGTTAINMPGSIAKDQALTKLFGVVGGAAKVPVASFALFTVRDVATMAAAFTLPTPMSAKMQEEFGVGRGWADGVSQLVSPGLIQFFSTPVHILGLDLYNHPGSSVGDRFKVIQQAFAPAIVLRVARIGVAFGVGGLGNTAIRKGLHRTVVSMSDA